MATVDIELRKYTRSDGTQPLVLRITAGNKVSRKNTGLYVKAAEWDAKRREVNRKNPNFARLNDALKALKDEAEATKADAIKARRAVVPSAIIDSIFATTDFYELTEARILQFRKENKNFTASNYSSMLSVLRKYVSVTYNSDKLAVEEITTKFVEDYRQYLKGLGRKHNTIVNNLSKLAAVLNSCDLKGANPFANTSRGTYKKAAPKPLRMEDIEALRRYIPSTYWEGIAKDAFLFSFYAAGMSSKDILLLSWEDIQHGRIEFGRRKVADTSGVQLSIPLNAVTSAILSKYDRSTTTVFNLVKILPDGKGSENSVAANRERSVVQALINRSLKNIALNSSIKKTFSFKDARTAFARIANEASGRNVYGIQQALGHSKIGTTEIYLGDDRRAVDELLAMVYR